jgi:hypothetical protein
MSHRDPSYVTKPFVPQTRDPVARALAFAAIVLLLANLAMTAYVFVFVRRVIAALAQLAG